MYQAQSSSVVPNTRNYRADEDMTICGKTGQRGFENEVRKPISVTMTKFQSIAWGTGKKPHARGKQKVSSLRSEDGNWDRDTHNFDRRPQKGPEEKARLQNLSEAL